MWHLFLLLTGSAVCLWWVTVAGVQSVEVRLETFKVQTAYNNPTEADFLFRIIRPVSSNAKPGFAEFLSVKTFIYSIPESKERAKLIGRNFEFNYQKQDSFWRRAETMGAAAVKTVYSDLFQVNEEGIVILPVHSANANY